MQAHALSSMHTQSGGHTRLRELILSVDHEHHAAHLAQRVAQRAEEEVLLDVQRAHLW